MKSGYVLDFSDRTFQEFVSSVTELDIYENKYNLHSGSKANRLRAYIKEESNYTVGLLLEQLTEYSMHKYKPADTVDNETFDFLLYLIKTRMTLLYKGTSSPEGLFILPSFSRLLSTLPCINGSQSQISIVVRSLKKCPTII